MGFIWTDNSKIVFIVIKKTRLFGKTFRNMIIKSSKGLKIREDMRNNMKINSKFVLNYLK